MSESVSAARKAAEHHPKQMNRTILVFEGEEHEFYPPNIKTEYMFPPIPSRNFDWCAYDSDTYDGPGSPLGHGATEAEAIADLMEQLNG